MRERQPWRRPGTRIVFLEPSPTPQSRAYELKGASCTRERAESRDPTPPESEGPAGFFTTGLERNHFRHRTAATAPSTRTNGPPPAPHARITVRAESAARAKNPRLRGRGTASSDRCGLVSRGASRSSPATRSTSSVPASMPPAGFARGSWWRSRWRSRCRGSRSRPPTGSHRRH